MSLFYATIKHTPVWRILYMFGQCFSLTNNIFGPWNRKSKHIYRKSSEMTLTDLDRQWLHLTVEYNWCSGRSSVTPQIAEGQSSAASKQCSAYWTLSDFPWPIFRASLMTSGGQRRAGTSDGATQSTGSCWLQGPKENSQTSMQASLSTGKYTKEGTWFKCTMPSGTAGHTPALYVASYIDTQCFLVFGCPVCVPLIVSINVSRLFIQNI